MPNRMAPKSWPTYARPISSPAVTRSMCRMAGRTVSALAMASVSYESKNVPNPRMVMIRAWTPEKGRRSRRATIASLVEASVAAMAAILNGAGRFRDHRLELLADGYRCFAVRADRVGRGNAPRLGPIRVDVGAGADQPDGPGVGRLRVFGEQPVDVDAGGVRVRRPVQQRHVARRSAHVRTLLQLRRWDDPDGRALLDPRLGQAIGGADQQRRAALADHVHLLLVVGLEGEVLLGQRPDEIGAEVRVQVEEDHGGVAGAGPARIVDLDLVLPLWVEQVLVGGDLAVLDQVLVVEQGAPLVGRHHEDLFVRPDQRQRAAAR